jgi:hypothetical protein
MYYNSVKTDTWPTHIWLTDIWPNDISVINILPTRCLFNLSFGQQLSGQKVTFYCLNVDQMSVDQMSVGQMIFYQKTQTSYLVLMVTEQPQKQKKTVKNILILFNLTKKSSEC